MQFIQAQSPFLNSIVNLISFVVMSKFEDDNSRNLKLLDDACKKLGIPKVVPFAKLAKGKFQDNMEFLKWLYGYANKTGPDIMETYNGYEKRMEAYCKQKGSKCYLILVNDLSNQRIEMSAHLFPNKEEKQGESKEEEETQNVENEDIKGENIEMSNVITMI